MKKKLASLLSVLLILAMFCGCGADPKTIDYNGKSYDDISQEAIINAYYVNLVQANVGGTELSAEEREAIISNNQYITNAMLDAYPKWSEIAAEYGECSTFMAEDFNPEGFITDDNFSVTKSGNTLTADLKLKFGEKDVIFELVYDYYSMEVTSIGIDPVQTMGEKMSNAGKNTIISMAIVFSVLILISLIISCFKIFPYLEERKKNKATAANAEEKPQVEATPVAAAPQTDDSELIAVIAAAIAASEGTSTSDFVVRSINRR